MSSINFNQSAVVALDTLRSINMNLQMVQNEISTGKKISNARDNAAVWSISTTMSSDVKSFEAITDSLNLGAATVGVARSASESVADLLQEMKTLVVAAQEENVDRTKIQADVDALNNQITAIVDAAQFNGLNLLKGTDDVTLLSSLNRSSTGVAADSITVQRFDLDNRQGVVGAALSGVAGAATGGGTTAAPTAVADAANADVTLAQGQLTVGDTFSFTLTSGSFSATVSEVASAGDTQADVVGRLVDQFNALNPSAAGVTVAITTAGDATTDTVVNVDNASGAGITFALESASRGAGTGGLGALASLDVTQDATVAAALETVETALDLSIDAAAQFGSAQMRIDIQNDFVISLIDSLDAGISALTDANLEEASARLQSLQVQQQLNIQALTIANQSPQAILALFQ